MFARPTLGNTSWATKWASRSQTSFWHFLTLLIGMPWLYCLAECYCATQFAPGCGKGSNCFTSSQFASVSCLLSFLTTSYSQPHVLGILWCWRDLEPLSAHVNWRVSVPAVSSVASLNALLSCCSPQLLFSEPLLSFVCCFSLWYVLHTGTTIPTSLLSPMLWASTDVCGQPKSWRFSTEGQRGLAKLCPWSSFQHPAQPDQQPEPAAVVVYCLRSTSCIASTKNVTTMAL